MIDIGNKTRGHAGHHTDTSTLSGRHTHGQTGHKPLGCVRMSGVRMKGIDAKRHWNTHGHTSFPLMRKSLISAAIEKLSLSPQERMDLVQEVFHPAWHQEMPLTARIIEAIRIHGVAASTVYTHGIPDGPLHTASIAALSDEQLQMLVDAAR